MADIKFIEMGPPPVAHTLQRERTSKYVSNDLEWYWLFTDDWHVKYSIDGKVYDHRVQKGTESDGGTIPGLAFWLINIVFRIYFIHDDGYAKGLYTRQIMDEILKAGILWEAPDHEDDAEQIYLGVRLGGKSHYSGVNND